MFRRGSSGGMHRGRRITMMSLVEMAISMSGETICPNGYGCVCKLMRQCAGVAAAVSGGGGEERQAEQERREKELVHCRILSIVLPDDVSATLFAGNVNLCSK